MKTNASTPAQLLAEKLLVGVESGADVLVQTGRHTSGTSPIWSLPFRDTLFVSRHKGVCVGLALNGTDFAEFDPRRDCEVEPEGIEFHAEDYILRILEINGSKVADTIECNGRNSRNAKKTLRP